MSQRQRKFLIGLVGVSAAGIAVPLHAQETAPPETRADAGEVSDEGRTGAGDIVVVAQRREQRLQDVPIAVSVVTDSALTAAGIGGTDELLAVTPGLLPTRQLKGSTPYIRGIGTQSVGAGVESPVATYVDGVYYMTTVGSIFSFNNIQRIEVLKGPQGTLFGRNTTGGLLNVITRDPSADPTIEGSFNYGNYDQYEASLYASAGTETLAADVAGYMVRNDGFGRNLTIGGRVNKLDEISVRGKILWRPGPDTKVTLAADYTRNESDMGATRNILEGSLGLTAVPRRGSIYDTQGGFLNDIRTDYWGVSLKVSQELGAVSLLSTTAFRDLDSLTHFDQDAVPANFANVAVNESAKTFQQEFLLIADLGSLNLTGGLFYFHAKNAYDPLAVRSIAPPNNYDSFASQRLNSYAAFIDGTYAVTDTTNVTAGIRYTIDKREFEAANVAVAGNSVPVGTVLARNTQSRAKFEKATFRFVLDQKLGDDVMAYASFNRGFKAGVFNASAITQPAVAPETVDAYEIGLKSDLFDRLLRFNLSVFRNDLKGIQLTRQTLGAQTIYNAASGRSKGIEAEATLRPRLAHGDLEISTNFTLLDAHYKSFPLGQRTVPNATGGNTVVVADLSGNRMIRAPKWTASLTATYSVPVGSNEFGISGSYYHNDGFFWEPDNRLRQESFDLLNAQAYFAFGPDDRFRVRIFGKNLTNQEYYSYVSAGGLGDLAAPSPPRTYGVGFDFSF